jgi:uncharacterized protein YcbX
MKEMTLETIIVYPIKALAGIRVSQARILPQSMGLENDRQWALERANGTLVNGKTEKKIHQLDARIQLDPLRVLICSTIGKGQYLLPRDKKQLEVALGKFFGYRVRLVTSDTHFADDQQAKGPTLIANETLTTVSKWFGSERLPEWQARFRSNLHLQGGAPFWEDTLLGKEFMLGTVRLYGQNLCRRCIVPSRLPQGGADTPNFISHFRRQRLPSIQPYLEDKNSYRLAVNTVLRSPSGGLLRCGDKVIL